MSDHIITTNPTQEELFLSRIKTETADLHQKLERSPLSVILMSPAITEQDYIDYLVAMREVIAWYESSVFTYVSNVVKDLDVRKKLVAIDRDLTALSALKTEFPGFSNPASEAHALGFMYVIEGSTLGGMVILKHLQGKSFISDETTNFFQVYGRNTGIYWREFIKVLSAYAVENNAENEVIEGAKSAFSQIDQYFVSVKKG